MILISSIQNDESTNNVIDWINHYRHSFLRINKIDDFKINFNQKNIFFLVNEEIVNFDEIICYWYRRGEIKNNRTINDNIKIHEDYLKNENKILNHYINHRLKKKSLGDKYNSDTNKLVILDLAQQCGLNIPNTYLIETRKNLLELLSDQSLITKGITNSNTFLFSNDNFGQIYTNEVSKTDALKLPKEFYPSLFQEKIDKKYEVRAFVLENKIWSMAIFSQSNETTKVDFRRDESKASNRKVPFILPKAIKKKLLKLLKILNLKTASIDILVDNKNEFFFLEINAIGQFGMVSNFCNYGIEKAITKYLINNGK